MKGLAHALVEKNFPDMRERVVIVDIEYHRVEVLFLLIQLTFVARDCQEHGTGG